MELWQTLRKPEQLLFQVFCILLFGLMVRIYVDCVDMMLFLLMRLVAVKGI